MIQEAYKKRWVDFAQNQGKSTGGFCASPYGKGSFILLSWNNRMADVFTLAHELGTPAISVSATAHRRFSIPRFPLILSRRRLP